MKGELEAKDVRMQEYLNQVKESFNLLHIPRSGNTHADSLATLATSSTRGLPRVILVYLKYQNYSLRNYMKGFVEVTDEADLCLTKPSLRDTGGQSCRRKCKNM